MNDTCYNHSLVTDDILQYYSYFKFGQYYFYLLGIFQDGIEKYYKYITYREYLAKTEKDEYTKW